MKNELLKKISKKRSVTSIESFLKLRGFTIIPPSGGDYKIWYDRESLITVKVIELNPEESIDQHESNDYDVLVGRHRWGDKVTDSVLVCYE